MLKEILDTIDSAVKKLVAPTAMVVAAAVISKGLKQPESSEMLIKGTMWFLVAWAFIYMFSSAVVALREFEKTGLPFIRSFLLGTSFFVIYIVLFIVGIFVALGKI